MTDVNSKLSFCYRLSLYFISILSVFLLFSLVGQAEEISTSTETLSIDENLTSASTNTATSTSTSTSSNQISTTTNTQSVDRPAVEYINNNPKLINEITLSENKQIRITNLAANISNRLEAVIYRHEKIANRLERRINKLEQSGENMSSAKAKLTETKKKISEAKETIAQIDKQVYEVVTSERPKTLWPDVKNTYLKTERMVFDNQLELSEVIETIKTMPTSNVLSTTTKNERVE